MQVSTARVQLLRQAHRLEWISAGWLLIEFIVALIAGITAHSLLLLAFGIDRAIELVSAGVLIWRLSVELIGRTEFPSAVEHRASRIAGGLLFALAIYVVVSSAWGLITHQAAEFSAFGLALSAIAMPVMYILSRRKLALAEKLGSRALRADAIESIACCWLALAVCIGLFVQFVSGAWWIDEISSLAIVYLLVREGLEAWEGDESGERS